MKIKAIFIFLSIALFISTANSQVINGKNDSIPPPPAPKPIEKKTSQVLKENLEKLPQDFEVSREKREQAYAKLLEGQRYIWSFKRIRSRSGLQAGSRLAKNALLQAVELDPKLAETYTALAEISYYGQDADEAISLAEIAIKLDQNNFGGHQLLGRLYTGKSNLGNGKLDMAFANKAIDEWKEIIRLSPRSAEAWAFLSVFFKETDQSENRIVALRNWVGSAEPLEDSTGFYQFVLAREGGLTSEAASMKLGEALLETGKTDEALNVLTLTVSDFPENLEAIELLSQALENAEGKSLKPAIEALRQAVYANPTNLSLNELLAKTIAKNGSIEEATDYLRGVISKLVENDKFSAGSFQISIGDIYFEENRFDEAIIGYQAALKIRGIEKQELATDDDRDFAFLVITKMIEAYKKANRFDDAKNLIANSRSLFGEEDSTLDREYILLLRDNGKKDEALKAVRLLRISSPLEYNLIRTEASILTDLGRVDEGVSVVRTLIDKKPEGVAPSIMYDDFTNYLFISSLFIQAKRTDDAITAANKAISSARGKESKQFGQMALASAHQTAGKFDAAEKILREVLAETPDNPIALNNLGYLFLESGKNYEDALHFINKALVIDPRNPSYLDSLGWAYFKLGKFAEAEKYLVKAAKYDSSSTTILEHLGDAYMKNGKIQEAKKVWKKATNFTSNKEDIQRLEKKISK